MLKMRENDCEDEAREGEETWIEESEARNEILSWVSEWVNEGKDKEGGRISLLRGAVIIAHNHDSS